MAKKSLTEKQKDRIYQLSQEDGFSQTKLADLYSVSQGTISNALKDKRHEVEIAGYKYSIENAMTRGVQAAMENGEAQFQGNTKYLK